MQAFYKSKPILTINLELFHDKMFRQIQPSYRFNFSTRQYHIHAFLFLYVFVMPVSIKLFQLDFYIGQNTKITIGYFLLAIN